MECNANHIILSNWNFLPEVCEEMWRLVNSVGECSKEVLDEILILKKSHFQQPLLFRHTAMFYIWEINNTKMNYFSLTQHCSLQHIPNLPKYHLIPVRICVCSKTNKQTPRHVFELKNVPYKTQYFIFYNS